MFATDEEIEAYIAGLPNGIGEFRQLIGSGRIAGVQQERGRNYLQRLDAREAADAERRLLEASERAGGDGGGSIRAGWGRENPSNPVLLASSDYTATNVDAAATVLPRA